MSYGEKNRFPSYLAVAAASALASGLIVRSCDQSARIDDLETQFTTAISKALKEARSPEKQEKPITEKASSVREDPPYATAADLCDGVIKRDPVWKYEKCFTDKDKDGVYSDKDNCQLANPKQEDSDSDGLGDLCDPLDYTFDVKQPCFDHITNKEIPHCTVIDMPVEIKPSGPTMHSIPKIPKGTEVAFLKLNLLLNSRWDPQRGTPIGGIPGGRHPIYPLMVVCREQGFDLVAPNTNNQSAQDRAEPEGRFNCARVRLELDVNTGLEEGGYIVIPNSPKAKRTQDNVYFELKGEAM